MKEIERNSEAKATLTRGIGNSMKAHPRHRVTHPALIEPGLVATDVTPLSQSVILSLPLGENSDLQGLHESCQSLTNRVSDGHRLQNRRVGGIRTDQRRLILDPAVTRRRRGNTRAAGLEEALLASRSAPRRGLQRRPRVGGAKLELYSRPERRLGGPRDRFKGRPGTRIEGRGDVIVTARAIVDVARIDKREEVWTRRR